MNNKVDFKRFEEYIKSQLKERNIVGVSVSVVKDGDVIYSNGFGFSNLLKNNITPDTIMSIQSITKSFASTSIMHLVEKGLLDLDKPVIYYLPYFRTLNKEESDKITVRQVLSHTAGFPRDVSIANLTTPNLDKLEDLKETLNELGLTVNDIKNYKSFEDITRYFKNVELAYKPGENWDYCTDAYVIVGDIFEKVSGMSWVEYVQENIFNRLDMTRSTLDSKKAMTDDNSARYHIKVDDDIKEVPFPVNEVSSPIGFIYSTASDMAKYLAGHMNEQLLSTASLKEMQNSYTNDSLDLPIPNLKNIGYGLGWFTGNYKGFKTVEHGGGFLGVRTYVRMIPSEKLGVVVLTNLGETDPIEISDKAINILIDK